VQFELTGKSCNLLGLTQKLSQTLIPLCSLRPLRFVYSLFCVSPVCHLSLVRALSLFTFRNILGFFRANLLPKHDIKNYVNSRFHRRNPL
jgi:hypothetical protein